MYLLYAVVLLKEYFSPISYIPADPADADTISIEPVYSLCSKEPDTNLALLLFNTFGFIITPTDALALAGI